MEESDVPVWLLLIDTCGEQGSVALFGDGQLLREVIMPERMASAALLGAVREVLRAAAVKVGELSGIGVVSGPGSFTGVRVGISMGKGLSEAANIPLRAVSRLAVLQDAGGGEGGVAMLHAGRNEVFVRENIAGQGASETLLRSESVQSFAAGRQVFYTEDTLKPLVDQLDSVRRVTLSAKDAYRLLDEAFRKGDVEDSLLDANYVRDEQAIYARRQVKP